MAEKPIKLVAVKVIAVPLQIVRPGADISAAVGRGVEGMFTGVRVDSQSEALFTVLIYQVVVEAGAVSPDITPEPSVDCCKGVPPDEAAYAR